MLLLGPHVPRQRRGGGGGEGNAHARQLSPETIRSWRCKDETAPHPPRGSGEGSLMTQHREQGRASGRSHCLPVLCYPLFTKSLRHVILSKKYIYWVFIHCWQSA